MSLFKPNSCVENVSIVGMPDPFADKVKCEECKHWIDKKDASSVSYFSWTRETNWYCPMHKKPYTRFIRAIPIDLYYG